MKKIHGQVFQYSLVLVVISLPYSIKINNIAIVLMVLNWIVEGNFAAKFAALRSNILFWLFAAFYTLHAIALVYTADLNEGLFQLEKKLPLLIFPFILASTTSLSKKQLQTVLFSFVLSIFVALTICLGYAFHRNNYLETFTNPVWFYFSYNDLTEVIDIQPNYLAIYVGFSIFILTFFLIENWHAYKVFEKLGRLLCITYFVLCLLLLSGRTPIAATIFIVSIASFYFFYKKGILLKGLLVWTVASLSLLVVMYQIPIIRERLLQTFGIEQQMTWISQMGDGKGGLPSIRLLKWKCAWEIIKDNWLIGVGPGDAQNLLQIQYKKINFDLAFNEKFNPHNQFLQTWLGLGFVGLISFVGSLAMPMVRSYRQKNHLYLIFVLFVFLCCITESVFERRLGIVFYAVFNSLLAFHFLADLNEVSIEPKSAD